MTDSVAGISAGWPTDRKTMNAPMRSIVASAETFMGGSAGISPSPCHTPINRPNSFNAAAISSVCR